MRRKGLPMLSVPIRSPKFGWVMVFVDRNLSIGRSRVVIPTMNAN